MTPAPVRGILFSVNRRGHRPTTIGGNLIGHDIYSYTRAGKAADDAFWAAWTDKNDETPDERAARYASRPKEVAYLRRNMSSQTIHRFYEAIGAEDLDAGVSGTGESRFFDILILRLASDKLRRDIGKTAAEVVFLEALIADPGIQADKGAVIHFG